MSSLPPKPEPGEISPRSPPQDDRRYTGRTALMAAPSQYRRDEPRRSDVYIARSPPRTRGPPVHGDSYVASDTYAPSAYDRREDDMYRRDYAEWDRRFGREYYSRERGSDRRGWERDDGARSWEARHDYDRRDRGHRANDRPPRDSSERDRRWRPRASVSPSRRAGSHHPPPERRRSSPRSPRRRHASSPNSRSASPSTSRQPSPTRRLRLGSHSIGSPRSPHGRSRTRNESPEKRRQYSRSGSNSPRRRSPRRSITPDKDSQKNNASAVRRERSPSPSRIKDEELKPQRQSHGLSESRPRTPAKAESVPDIVMSNEPPPQGTVKEEPPAVTEADGDVKMHEPSPPLPTGPRSSLPAREPPKGPRGFVQPPTGPALRLSPTKPDWSSRTTPQSALGSSFARAELLPSPQTAEPVVTTSLPTIPVYKPKTILIPELDGEIARLQVQRAHLTSEYIPISKAARRALHELEMASCDLRAAEDRRKLADSHVEKARLGVLGIDHLPTAST